MLAVRWAGQQGWGQSVYICRALPKSGMRTCLALLLQVALTEALDMVYDMAQKQMTITF